MTDLSALILPPTSVIPRLRGGRNRGRSYRHAILCSAFCIALVVSAPPEVAGFDTAYDQAWDFLMLGDDIHSEITRTALAGISRPSSQGTIVFSHGKIDWVILNNWQSDVGEASKNPVWHFDDERFSASSRRLLALKQTVLDLVREVDATPKHKGMVAALALGLALHTLQDFYSHSNWVENGNTEPHSGLGREAMADPISRLFIARVPCSTIDPSSLNTPGPLTTGYYHEMAGSCRPPVPGLCVHGSVKSISCWGINKDGKRKHVLLGIEAHNIELQNDGVPALRLLANATRARERHEQAKETARLATIKYVNEILDDLGDNERAICVLMEWQEEDGEDPCERYARPIAAIKLASGPSANCVILSDQTLSCWGNDNISDGVPRKRFRQVSVGRESACGILLVSEKIKCWGYSDELVDARPRGRFLQVSVGDTPGSDGFACAIRKEDRSVVCWGEIDDGRDTEAILKRPPAGEFRSVSVGGWHACALNTARRVICWGFGFEPITHRDPQYDFGGYDFDQIASWQQYTCGVRSASARLDRARGSLVCWSSRFTCAQTSAGSEVCDHPSRPCRPENEGYVAPEVDEPMCVFPRKVTEDEWSASSSDQDSDLGNCGGFQRWSADGRQTQPDTNSHAGIVNCWSFDLRGPINQGMEFRADFKPVRYDQVAVVRNVSCGIESMGKTIECVGRLGDPIVIESIPAGTFVSISAGEVHMCGIRSNGTVACWGSNPNVSRPDADGVMIDGSVLIPPPRIAAAE